jgi:hypothetical protein
VYLKTVENKQMRQLHVSFMKEKLTKPPNSCKPHLSPYLAGTERLVTHIPNITSDLGKKKKKKIAMKDDSIG